MANCDICNAVMDVSEGTAYTIEELQEMIGRGFGPPDKLVQTARSAGWTMEQIIARWRQELDARPQPYWTLCPSCAARAAKYLPAVEEPAAPAEPAPPPEIKPIAPAATPPEAAEPALTAEAPGPEEPLPEEPPALAETPRLAPLLPRKQPPTGRTFLIGLLIGVLGGIAFFLLILDRYLHPLPPAPVTTLAVQTPTIPLPTRPSPTRKPATPRPTEALYPPTVIPIPDLAGAVLGLSDVPKGFRVMTADDRAGVGITEDSLRSNFGYAQARVQHLAAFRYPRTSEFVLTFLVCPLTGGEQSAFDQALSPASGLALVAAVLSGQEYATPARLDGLDSLGDKSIGIMVRGAGDTAALRTDIVLIRRGAVVEVIAVRYVEGNDPRMAVDKVAGLLDGRVRSALGVPQAEAVPLPVGLPLAELSAMVLWGEDLPGARP